MASQLSAIPSMRTIGNKVSEVRACSAISLGNWLIVPSLTGAPHVNRRFGLSVSTREVPVLTPQRRLPLAVWLQTNGRSLLAVMQCSLERAAGCP